MRFATLAQAIRRTKATAPSISHRPVIVLSLRKLLWSGSTDALQPLLVDGFSSAICLAMLTISALARATVTPGFSRAITRSQWKSWLIWSGLKASGTRTSVCTRSPGPAARTPTMVWGFPSSLTVCPRIFGSEAKRSRHTLWERITTSSRPTSPSSGRKSRPIMSCSPNIVTKPGVSRSTWICSGRPDAPKLSWPPVHAFTSWKTVLRFFHSR